MLVVFVACSCVYAWKLFAPIVPGEEGGFDVLVCLTLPTIFWQFFTLCPISLNALYGSGGVARLTLTTGLRRQSAPGGHFFCQSRRPAASEGHPWQGVHQTTPLKLIEPSLDWSSQVRQYQIQPRTGGAHIELFASLLFTKLDSTYGNSKLWWIWSQFSDLYKCPES